MLQQKTLPQQTGRVVRDALQLGLQGLLLLALLHAEIGGTGLGSARGPSLRRGVLRLTWRGARLTPVLGRFLSRVGLVRKRHFGFPRLILRTEVTGCRRRRLAGAPGRLIGRARRSRVLTARRLPGVRWRLRGLAGAGARRVVLPVGALGLCPVLSGTGLLILTLIGV